MRYFHTMFMSRLISVRSCAAALMLALGLAGTSYASSTSTSTKKAHSTAHLHHTSSTRTRTSSSHKASLHHTSYSSRHRKSGHHHSTITGQRVMDSSRAMEIQQALIQAHYLSGSPTGQWDGDTQAAMVKYQNDNGWQTKITPDSRALIKFGIGTEAGCRRIRCASSRNFGNVQRIDQHQWNTDGHHPHHGDFRNPNGHTQQLNAAL